MDCPICMNHFTGTSGIHVPKVFSCGHSICEACLTALRTVPGENVECPLCRAVTAATEISTNYALCSLLDATAATSATASANSVSLMSPSAPPATAFTSLSPGQLGQLGQPLSQPAQHDMSAASCFEYGTHFYCGGRPWCKCEDIHIIIYAYSTHIYMISRFQDIDIMISVDSRGHLKKPAVN